MPKFAKAETQAENVVKGLIKSRIIKSYGTARNFEHALRTVAKWSKENKLNGLQSLAPDIARHYL